MGTFVEAVVEVAGLQNNFSIVGFLTELDNFSFQTTMQYPGVSGLQLLKPFTTNS